MAYRRRHGLGRSATFQEDIYHQKPAASVPMPKPSIEEEEEEPFAASSSSSMSAQAIKASVAHRDYASRRPIARGGPTYDYISMASSNDGGSFWGVLARKAKAILDEDNKPHLAKFTSGIQQEGYPVVENKNADFETRKIQIKRNEEQNHTNHEDQLKASRDVAMATAAKAKLLLRELKTVKADLAFCKQRCSQLEEENKMLREGREKGVNPADDDMIRCQLETLLEEKARLAHENSVYARENRFLREIVEYHQLTMQDLVYLEEGIDEELTEVHPVSTLSRRSSISSSSSNPLSRTTSLDKASPTAEAIAHLHPREYENSYSTRQR